MTPGAMANDTPALRKARGAFFTPPELARFVTAWAIRSARDVVFEPSCGEAVFLSSAGERLAQLGSRVTADQLQGVEIHAASAAVARDTLASRGLPATIATSDFFDHRLPFPVDVVVGNPPYVRYQDFAGAPRAKAQQAALAQGVRLPGLASSWAAFVVHASTFLKPDGRMGLVLPAELLTANYAAAVRRFVMQRFARVRLVLFEARVFPEVLQEVLLLLAEGTGPTDHCELYQARNLSEMSDFHVRNWRPSPVEAKWTPALLPSGVQPVYADLLNGEHFCRLKDWGEIDLGMVTGNNAYFALSVDQAQAAGLRDDDLIKISPPSSRHLRGLTFSDKLWAELARKGSRVYLFYPDSLNPSPAALRYIADGEAARVHTAYKCQARLPWWRVPTGKTADLFVTYMNHDAPRLVTNRARVRHLNSVHGLRLRRGLKQLGMDLLPLGALNSVTLLGAELVGRSYGGGVLKLEPKEADLLPVPSPDLLAAHADALRAAAPQVGRALRGGDLAEAARLVDRIVFRGACKPSRADLAALREAREALFARRIGRAGTPA